MYNVVEGTGLKSMIGIIGAMEVEVEEILGRMKEERSDTVSGIIYHIGTIGNKECVVAKCGVGKVAAAVCAQTMILRYAPSAIINVGIAGGIGPGIHIGDIIVANGFVQHDMDTSAVGDEKGLISGLNLVVIPVSKRLLSLTSAAAEKLCGKDKAHTGIIATGDQFINDRERLERIRAEFGACACEMEGGSIAQVCYMNQTPFAAVRAVSDNADEAAAVNYAEFFKSSAHTAAELISGLVPNL
jgi:adenosylhomocysteine nucleosidase